MHSETDTSIMHFSTPTLPQENTWNIGHAFGRRACAFFVDICFIIAMNTLINMIYFDFLSEFFNFLPESFLSHLTAGSEWLHISTTSTLFLSYFTLCFYTFEGRSLGAKLTGIRVVNQNFIHSDSSEYHLNLKDSIRRAMGMMLCYISFCLFFAFALAHKKGQHFADFYSRAQSISEEEFQYILNSKKQGSQIIHLPYFEEKVA